jgi:hypothetical protein
LGLLLIEYAPTGSAPGNILTPKTHVKNDEIDCEICPTDADTGVTTQSELDVTVAIGVSLAAIAEVRFELLAYAIHGKAATSNNNITKYLSIDIIFNLASFYSGK